MLAADLPDDRAGDAIQQEARPGVARRDQQVAVRQRIDRVDVEVVEDARALRGNRAVGVRDRDVRERIPLPHHKAGLDVDLLHDAVVDQAAARAANAMEVPMNRRIGRDESGVLRCDPKVVQVRVQTVARVDLGDRRVAAAVHLVDALAVELDRATLPPGQHRLPLVGLHVEVERARWVVRRVKPYERPRRADDHRPRPTGPRVRCDEDVAEPLVGGRYDDPDGRWHEVGSRVEVLDVCRCLSLRLRWRRLRQHVGICHIEVSADTRGARAGHDRRRHRDLFARRERLVRQEAATGAGRIGLQLAVVDPAA